MKLLKTVAEVREWRAAQSRVGFVPTMGALHEGHLELMRRSVEENPTTLISIFVNPTQFGPNEDLANYPRSEEQDIALAQEAGVEAVFLPSVEEMYPDDPAISIQVGGPASEFEGERRPGHFAGVATVVAKLFNIAQPSAAYFGLKDLQQCAVIRALVDELAFDIELRFVETVREESGLALSSRNRYFTAEQRADAAAMHRELSALAHRLNLERPANRPAIDEALSAAILNLEALGFRPEYLDFVNPQSMTPLSHFEADGRLIVSAVFCGVRLIDNLSVQSA